MSFAIGKRFSFSASHALTAVPEGHKCRRVHGHNYELEVVCEATELDHRGMVLDYFELDPVKAFVDEVLDHRHLNDIVPGEPTAERLAWWAFEQLRERLPAHLGGRVVAVRVHETPRTWAEYRPG